MFTKKFFTNLITAFSAQAISLIISFFMSLIVPKNLGVLQYSYWQLFIFYVGYVGFFHFGFNDGLYLKLGGKERTDLDLGRLKSKFLFLLIFETLLGFILAVLGAIIINDYQREFVIVFTCIYMVLNNLTLFYGYIFQAINETKIFSYSTIIDRIFVLVTILVLLFLEVDEFQPFIIAYTVSKFLSLIYCLIKGREITYAKMDNQYRYTFHEMFLETKSGIKLMLANIASMLILGIGRIVIDDVWGVEAFGKISFSISLANFFLMFISQASMVMFPALRKIDGKSQKRYFEIIRLWLTVLLPLVLCFYVPIKLVLNWWLPAYSESVKFLIIMLPLCLFDSKMQMLYSTYLKVLQKENLLLKINLISVILSFSLSVLFGYVFKEMNLVVVSMLISIIFRSLLADRVVSSALEIKIIHLDIYEIVLTFIFVLSSWFLQDKLSLTITIIGYCIYLCFVPRKFYMQLKNIFVKIKTIGNC